MKKDFNTYIVIGLQWGDEGKGKILQKISEGADYIVKYQGGNNSGHAVYKDNGEKFKLNVLPVGITNPSGKCFLSAGTLIDIDSLLEEVDLVEQNFKTVDNLYIDSKAHLIMPYHELLDQIKKENNFRIYQKNVKQGMDSCHSDKIFKKGIRMCDLLNLETFSNKLINNLKEKNEIFLANGEVAFEFDFIYSKYEEYAKRLKGIIVDSILLLNKAVNEGKKVVFESSDSAMLDINLGTYPNVSWIPTVASTVSSCTGIPACRIQNTIGVFKAYTTQPYTGIFPSEVFGYENNFLRDHGNEFIRDTGIARRCGWLDLVILKYSSLVNGVTELNMTKLDVLTGLEKIKLAIAYDIEGKIHHIYPTEYDETKEINIIYKEFDGWTEDISNITDYEDLPENCKRYIEYIEGYLEIKITLISVGPKKEQIIIK